MPSWLILLGWRWSDFGNLFIADTFNNRIRMVSKGTIMTVAGGGTGGLGDNGAATNASLYFPEGVAVDAFGNLFIADQGSNRVRKVTNTQGPISGAEQCDHGQRGQL